MALCENVGSYKLQRCGGGGGGGGKGKGEGGACSGCHSRILQEYLCALKRKFAVRASTHQHFFGGKEDENCRYQLLILFCRVSENNNRCETLRLNHSRTNTPVSKLKSRYTFPLYVDFRFSQFWKEEWLNFDCKIHVSSRSARAGGILRILQSYWFRVRGRKFIITTKF